MGNQNTNPINFNIHSLIEKSFTFINASTRVSQNKGALIKATQSDEKILRLFGLEKAQSIANELKNGKYAWQPVRRVWRPKPGKHTRRTIDTPSQKGIIV